MKGKKEIATVTSQRDENAPVLCGPGCACGKETTTSKWKIVIMLVVLAAVGLAFLYRVAL